MPVVTIHDRVLADLGPTGRDYVEPALAMTRAYRVGASAWQFQSATPTASGRGMSGSNQSSSWFAEYFMPSGLGGFSQDMSVAVVHADPVNPQFVACGFFGGLGGSGGIIQYSTWSPSSGFALPVTAYDDALSPGGGFGVDKPWVIRRAADDFLLFFLSTPYFGYLRTTDGGNWRDGAGGLAQTYHVATEAGEEPVSAFFCCHPSIAADGSVLLAHTTAALGPPPGSNGKFRVLIGQGGNSGPLSFVYAKETGGQPIEWAPRRFDGFPLPVPCPNEGIKSRTVPYIVCDPSNDTLAYVVYQDSDPDYSEDINVYVAKLLRQGSSWSVSISRIDDEAVAPNGERADQFVPAMAVDSKGWIHLLYYDNRPACGGSGWTDKYDAYYALSTDHGAHFEHWNLRTNCESDPALNLGLQAGGVPGSFTPNEYNGIAFYESGGTTRVWVLYTGTYEGAGDDPAHRSVIFGQQIVVTNSP